MVKKTLKLTLAFILIVGGIVGLFLPVLQGVLMITAGLMLLGTEWPWLGKKLEPVVEKLRRKRKEKNQHHPPK